MIDDPTDDELLERLRSLDPAASLPPADPARMARLLEDAMSHDQSTDIRRRTPLTWLVAAAAVLVIAGVGAFALFGGDEPVVPTAKDPAPSVVELSARPPSAAKCAVPTAELLGNQQTAFDGTVTSLTDGVVTLDVGHWYRGGPADQVTVDAPPADMQALVSGGRLPGRPALPRLGQRRVRHGVRVHRGLLRRARRSLRAGLRRLAWPGDRRRTAPRGRRRHADGDNPRPWSSATTGRPGCTPPCGACRTAAVAA